jgi:hypothetical protein
MDTPASPLNDANEESEVIFKYNFTGTLSDRKFWRYALPERLRLGPDASLAFVNSTTGDELDVELDIIQAFQTPSTTSTSTVQLPSSDSACVD